MINGDALQPQPMAIEFQGLLSIVAANGDVVDGITLEELEAINTIREIVNDTTESNVVTYTGS